MTFCDRCKKASNLTKMSWFNLDILCIKCSEKEEKHPKYEEARKAEIKECKKGNFNFEGIGYTEPEVKDARS